MTDHAHAVEDGKLLHTSVSQIQNYATCARAWWFNKVAHIPGKPPSKGQQTGIEGHARLEQYYEGLDVLSPLEKLGVERAYVPPRSLTVTSEHHIGDPIFGLEGVPLDAAGVKLEGYLDLVERWDSKHFRITDWKFKASIDKYGITEADVFNPESDAGIQLIGYAEWARRQFPTATKITAGHVTFQTKGARDVSAVFDTIEVDKLPALWESVTRHVHGMLQVARESDWHKVPGTFSACGKYGGCAYREKCFDPLARLTAAISGISLKLEGRSMGLLSSTVQPPTVQQVTSAEADNAAALAGFFGQADMTIPLVLPPDVPVPTSLASYSNSAVPAPQEQPVAETASPAADSPKKRRGRPAKVSPTATQTATAPVVAPTVPAAPVGESLPVAPAGGAESSRATTASGATGSTTPVEVFAIDTGAPAISLYFNAMRMGVEMRSLASFTRMVELDFLKRSQSNLIDLRAATSSELGFAKWKAYLGAAAVGRIAELPPGHYAVMESDERIQCVAEALAAALPGDATVRGTR